MPLPLPSLDDRTFADLADEARAMLPALCPAWTDHNPADPGITVLELLAWLTETVIFRLDQMSDRNTDAFLRLLGGGRRAGESVDDAARRTVTGLRTLYRAVSADDYEELALTQWPSSPEADELRAAGGDAGLARVRAVPRRDLGAADASARRAEAPAHVSLVVVPAASTGRLPVPDPALCAAIRAFLEPRRLLTVRPHVVGPAYVPIDLGLTAYVRADAPLRSVAEQIAAAVHRWFDPLRGGPDGRGLPFGRDVHVSELDAEVSRIPLVEFVEDITLDVPGEPDRLVAAAGVVTAVRLDRHELVDVHLPGLLVCAPDGTRYAPAPSAGLAGSRP